MGKEGDGWRPVVEREGGEAKGTKLALLGAPAGGAASRAGREGLL